MSIPSTTLHTPSSGRACIASCAVDGIVKKTLLVLLLGPQDAITLALAIQRSPQWTRRAIRQLRQQRLLMVADTYTIGRLTRVRYTLTAKGVMAANQLLQ